MVLPTRIRRLALIAAGVPLAATMTTMMLASPVAAAPSANAALVRPASTVHHYRTVVRHLRVRKAPHTAAPVVHVLGAAGTRVSVTCFAVGSSVNGDRIWYHIVAPAAGFVAGFYLNTGRDPAAGIPACFRHPHGHVFHTLAHGLRVRTAPRTTATTIVRLGPAGTKVAVNCFVVGKPVFGDSVWYHIVRPARGFVAGFYLDTGHDPAAGIRPC